jgi:hypothetical protein
MTGAIHYNHTCPLGLCPGVATGNVARDPLGLFYSVSMCAQCGASWCSGCAAQNITQTARTPSMHCLQLQIDSANGLSCVCACVLLCVRADMWWMDGVNSRGFVCWRCVVPTFLQEELHLMRAVSLSMYESCCSKFVQCSCWFARPAAHTKVLYAVCVAELFTMQWIFLLLFAAGVFGAGGVDCFSLLGHGRIMWPDIRCRQHAVLLPVSRFSVEQEWGLTRSCT